MENVIEASIFDSFTLLFCRGRQGIVRKCVPHVRHACFSSFDESNCYGVLVTVAFVYAKSRWCSNLNSRTNYIKLWSERALTHLTFVCHISSKLLAGSRFNEVDKHHQTALHLAAANNSASILSILLENGAEPDAADDKGNNGKQWLLFLKFIVSMAIRIVYFFFAETVSRHKTSFSWGVMKGC